MCSLKPLVGKSSGSKEPDSNQLESYINPGKSRFGVSAAGSPALGSKFHVDKQRTAYSHHHLLGWPETSHLGSETLLACPASRGVRHANAVTCWQVWIVSELAWSTSGADVCLSVELCPAAFKGLKTLTLRKYPRGAEGPVSVVFLAKSPSLPFTQCHCDMVSGSPTLPASPECGWHLHGHFLPMCRVPAP